ncbi:rRNA-processing protein UTP11 [Sporobolomyces koalae]|uniref:rRNA-processing protein UTP11 n=1 Tax=Sporobolomyces koalae TaxID=500713 RepID=UPI0031774C8D
MVANKLNEQKRQHRERSQPAHRKKLGLLEKHADYVKRARDFHSKEDRIQKLKEKASFRNKDEFYHSMVNKQTKNGIHIQSRGNEALPVDLVKVLKTQDAGYIRTHMTMEQARVHKLQERIASLVDHVLPQPIKPVSAEDDASEDTLMNGDDWDLESDFDDDDEPIASGSGRTHVVFTDDLDQVRNADPTGLLTKRTTPTSLPVTTTNQTATTTTKTRRSNKKKGKSKASSSSSEQQQQDSREQDLLELSQQARQHRENLVSELEQRQERLVQLKRAMRELELQKIMMSKGARKEVISHSKSSGDRNKEQEEWWLGGSKPGKHGKKGAESEERAGLPHAQEGINTGARVWKFKAHRKR